MKPKTSIRYVTPKNRNEQRCYLCDSVGHHKWFDAEINHYVCSDCLAQAAAAEKFLQQSTQHSH